jgi:mannose-6-phosphate isomerase-like protein (cupin superfamily)
MKKSAYLGIFLSAALPLAFAQGNPVDVQTPASLNALAQKLQTEAMQSPSGIAAAELDKYSDHYTVLAYRSKSGGAEEHAHYTDMFMVLDGGATLVTGGTISDEKTGPDGESRGAAVVGGTSQPLHKGDIVHISPNVPHQLIMAPGQHFLYYVIKIRE